MTSQVGTKIRFVRCPKCLKILPELPEVSLYKCGGCGTTLQAKNRKMKMNQTEPSSNNDSSSPPNGESSFDRDNEIYNGDSSIDHLGESKSLLSTSTEVKSFTESEDMASEVNHIPRPSSMDHPGEDKSVISTSPEVNGRESEVIANEVNIPASSMDLGEKGIVFPNSLEVNCGESEFIVPSSLYNLCEDKRIISTSPKVNCSESEDMACEVNIAASTMNPGENTSVLSTLPEVNYSKSEDMACEVDLPSDMDLVENRSVLSTLTETNCFESKDMACEVDISTSMDLSVLSFSSEVNCGESEDLHGDAKSSLDQNSANWTQGSNSSDELPISAKVKELTNGHMEPDDESHLSRSANGHQNEYEETQKALEETENFLDHVRNSPELKDQEADLPPGVGDGMKDENTPLEDDDKGNGLDSSCAEIVSHEIVSLSQSAELSIEKTEKHSSTGVGDSTLAPQNSSKSIISVDNGHSDDCASPVDTMGSSSLIVKRGDMANSPTTRSHYAYDGSESSYDGTDDHQIPEHIIISHPHFHKDVNPISTREIIRKDRRKVVNNDVLINSELEMNYWRPSPSSSILQEENQHHHAMKAKSHVIGNRMRNGSPSVYHHNLLPPRPDSHLHSVPNKMDLLRTVCELKEQLDRIQFPKSAQNSRFPSAVVMPENHASHSCDHLAPEMEMYADFNHPGCHLRHNQAKSWAPHYRHQISCSCLHCCPQDWPHSAQLPSSYAHGFTSSPSPQHYSSSDQNSLWGRDSNLGDQRPRSDDEIKRSYLKEKYGTAKRHLRPVACGAPVVACCNCSKILQLPVDFLLVEKKIHRLRCGSCTKVSKFSLIEKTHIVPYASESRVAPISCSDDYGVRSLDREMSSGSYHQQKEDKKMNSVMEESHDKKTSLFGSIGASSKGLRFKKSWEIEEVPPSKNSPLHWLMGYSSPSQVFRK